MIQITKPQRESALLSWRQFAMRMTFEVKKYLEDFDEDDREPYIKPLTILETLRDKQIPAFTKKIEKISADMIDYKLLQTCNKQQDRHQLAWYAAQNKIQSIQYKLNQ